MCNHIEELFSGSQTHVRAHAKFSSVEAFAVGEECIPGDITQNVCIYQK